MVYSTRSPPPPTWIWPGKILCWAVTGLVRAVEGHGRTARGIGHRPWDELPRHGASGTRIPTASYSDLALEDLGLFLRWRLKNMEDGEGPGLMANQVLVVEGLRKAAAEPWFVANQVPLVPIKQVLAV